MKNTHGGARPGSGPKPTPLHTGRLLSLRAQGYGYAEIGRRLGVSSDIVQRALRKLHSESSK